MKIEAQMMQAIAIQCYGGPEVLELIEMPRPIPSAGEVLIRNAAIGVNPADAKWRMGMFRTIIPVAFPYVPGYDVVGSIVCGGSLAAGTRVVAMLDNLKGGAYAQFAVVAEQAVAPIPDGLDDATAAALPTPALTGVQLIEEHVLPWPGDRVLITGASGAVGRFALHAAKTRGAYVIAAVRAEHRRAVLALGADEAVVLGEMSNRALALDHVVDTVGGAAVAYLCRHLRPCGSIKTVSTTPIPPAGLASVPEFVTVHPDGCRLGAIARSVMGGNLAVPITHQFSLAEAAVAHRYLDAGRVGGKIILSAFP